MSGINNINKSSEQFDFTTRNVSTEFNLLPQICHLHENWGWFSNLPSSWGTNDSPRNLIRCYHSSAEHMRWRKFDGRHSNIAWRMGASFKSYAGKTTAICKWTHTNIHALRLSWTNLHRTKSFTYIMSIYDERPRKSSWNNTKLLSGDQNERKENARKKKPKICDFAAFLPLGATAFFHWWNMLQCYCNRYQRIRWKRSRGRRRRRRISWRQSKVRLLQSTGTKEIVGVI